MTISRNLAIAAAAIAIAGPLVGPVQLRAQSAQVYSLQASGLATSLRFNGSNAAGTGFEAQLRHNQIKEFSAGVFSVGVGFQSTKHRPPGAELTIKGVFLEPRVAFALGSNNTIFPYIAGRFAWLKQSSQLSEDSRGKAYGGGGGAVIRMSGRLNLDIGVAAVVQTFNPAAATGTEGRYSFEPFLGYAAKLGFSLGL